MSYLGFDQYALVDQVLSRGYVVHHLLRNHLKYWYIDYLVLNQIMRLKKLTEPKDIPDYIKQKTQVKSNRFTDFIKRIFSTHPTLTERLDMVKKKSEDDLPFNWYENHISRLLTNVREMTTWKTVSVG
jgi:hypothetical protein